MILGHEMVFCTLFQCKVEGIQDPIIKYFKENHHIAYVDVITQPGLRKILAMNNDRISVNSIIKRNEISIKKHGSKLIAISGHHDCAGNPCDEEIQKQQIIKPIKHLKNIYSELKIIGLWIDNEWDVRGV